MATPNSPEAAGDGRTPPPARTAVALLGLALAVLILFTFAPVRSCNFVDYDDDIYVINNTDIHGGITPESVWWAFTATRSNHWHPLTWISLALDVDLFGLRACGFHITNLVLHTANVLLLFEVLRRMTGASWRSAAVAALFAVHPLRVESVAWVTERKDVLSTFFWLLTTGAYVRYARAPGLRRFGTVLLCFVLGLLAKPMLMTLPFTLLLLDWWPLRRITSGGASEASPAAPFAPAPVGRLLAEKVPLFLAGAGSFAASLVARHAGGGIQSGEYLSLAERLGYALNAPAAYLLKTVWPVGLAPLYPLTPGGLPAAQVAGAAAVLGLVTYTAASAWRQRPYFLVGWLWYLGTLVPVSGVVQLGSYAMADRYTYVPSIGLYVALVWGVADLAPRFLPARFLALATVMLVLFAALASREQIRHWTDSVSLWEHTRDVTSDNFLARTHLGKVYLEGRRLDDAEAEFLEALRLRPDLAYARDNLGLVYLKQGRAADAASCFRGALERRPGDSGFRLHLIDALRANGQGDAADEEYRALLGTTPDR